MPLIGIFMPDKGDIGDYNSRPQVRASFAVRYPLGELPRNMIEIGLVREAAVLGKFRD